MTASNSPTKLLLIDTKTLRHTAYEGKERVASSKFTRTLDPGEIAVMRVDPTGFLGAIDAIDEEVAA